MKNIALIISFLLHPALLLTYACLFIFYVEPNTVYYIMTPPETKWRVCLIMFLFSFLFPVSNIYVLYKLKRLPSLILSNRNERTIPYLITAMFYLGLFYLLKDVRIWDSLKLFVVSASISIVLVALINLKYKISAHLVGLGGLLAFFTMISILIKFDFTYVYLIVIFLAGLTGFARLYLKEHTPTQIYLGFGLGFAVQVILFFIFQNLTFA